MDNNIIKLSNILSRSNKIMNILNMLSELNIPYCYLAAGCINQTVFNFYHGYDLDYGISDYDIVYYDNDISYETEDRIIKKINSCINDKSIIMDIKNQARVYLWYYEKYGIRRDKYKSIEDAISRWTSTVTCIGVRLIDGKLDVCAPYGLDDLFNMVIRPVKKDVSRNVYDNKCIKWKSIWNKLEIITWDGE